MIRALSEPKSGMRLMSLSFAALLAAAPVIAEAQSNPVAPQAPAAALRNQTLRRRPRRRPVSAGRSSRSCSRRSRFIPTVFWRRFCPPAPIRSRSFRSTAGSTATRTPWRRTIIRARRRQIRPGGEGSGALSRRHQQDERESRLDDRPWRRLRQSAEGCRGRHPGSTGEGRDCGNPEVVCAADRHEQRPGRPKHHRHRSDRPVDGLCPVLRSRRGLPALHRHCAPSDVRGSRGGGRRDLCQQLLELGNGLGPPARLAGLRRLASPLRGLAPGLPGRRRRQYHQHRQHQRRQPVASGRRLSSRPRQQARHWRSRPSGGVGGPGGVGGAGRPGGVGGAGGIGGPGVPAAWAALAALAGPGVPAAWEALAASAEPGVQAAWEAQAASAGPGVPAA